MSSAHRPTFHPAVGSSTPGGYRFHAPRASVHAKEQHGQLTIKYRQPAQQLNNGDTTTTAAATATHTAKQQLEQREEKAKTDRKRHRSGDTEEDNDDEDDKEKSTSKQHKQQLLLTSGEEKSDDSKEEAEEGEEEPHKLDVSAVDLSAFDDTDAVLSDREQDDSSDEADNTSDDDEAELQRELTKIKAEREAERIRKAAEEAATQAANTALLHSNPLLSVEGAGGVSFGAKRRWDDDVVFKNQKVGDVMERAPKRFINDSIRNDFHKSFLKRYVR